MQAEESCVVPLGQGRPGVLEKQSELEGPRRWRERMGLSGGASRLEGAGSSAVGWKGYMLSGERNEAFEAF